jgi:hypothetical protein
MADPDAAADAAAGAWADASGLAHDADGRSAPPTSSQAGARLRRVDMVEIPDVREAETEGSLRGSEGSFASLRMTGM